MLLHYREFNKMFFLDRHNLKLKKIKLEGISQMIMECQNLFKSIWNIVWSVI